LNGKNVTAFRKHSGFSTFNAINLITKFVNRLIRDSHRWKKLDNGRRGV